MRPEGFGVKLRFGTGDRALTQYLWLGKVVPSRAWGGEPR